MSDDSESEYDSEDDEDYIPGKIFFIKMFNKIFAEK